MVNFDLGMQAKVPLSNQDKLGNPEFSVPFSFVYGDDDWVPFTDEGTSEKLVANNQFSKDSGNKSPAGTPSQYHICPSADHNMHMDNPIAFANIIINDLVEGANEPVLTVA